MKITKNYPGLTRSENGDYILNGSLISEEGIEIELDDSLVVTGKIKAGGGITAEWGIEAGWVIEAGRDIETRCGIKAGWDIKAVCGIKAGWYIEAGDEIESGWVIEAGGGIKAGCGIKAGAYIDCGKRIFAGTSVFDDENSCEKTIKCAELRNGSVAYGDLIITKQEDTNED